jgi:hypothetical protein
MRIFFLYAVTMGSLFSLLSTRSDEHFELNGRMIQIVGHAGAGKVCDPTRSGHCLSL